MSNEHLPVDHPWAGQGLSHQIVAALDHVSHHPTAQVWRARLSGTMIYLAGTMLAFVFAVDGYVLLRTM